MKKILTLLLLMLLAIPVYSADQDTVYIADIETWVVDLLNGITDMWTSTVIRSQINLAQREYATLIGITKEDTILTVNGQTNYALNSDFWSIRGVLKLSSGRTKLMRQKGISVSAPQTKGLGEESIDTNKPKYYAIKDGQTIIIDPPESGAATDTIIITYNVYATELAGADSMTNVPYGGIPVIVYGTVLNLMIRNREDAFVQIMLPVVQAKYQTIFNAVKAQESSSFDYDPATKPK